MGKDLTLEDLWPGDIIVATRPGGYTGMPSRFVYAEELPSADNMVRVHLARGDWKFSVFAKWNDPVEIVE